MYYQKIIILVITHLYFIVGTTLSATEICDTPKKKQEQNASLLRKAFATDPQGLVSKHHTLTECLEPYLLPKALVNLILQYYDNIIRQYIKNKPLKLYTDVLLSCKYKKDDREQLIVITPTYTWRQYCDLRSTKWYELLPVGLNTLYSTPPATTQITAAALSHDGTTVCSARTRDTLELIIVNQDGQLSKRSPSFKQPRKTSHKYQRDYILLSPADSIIFGNNNDQSVTKYQIPSFAQLASYSINKQKYIDFIIDALTLNKRGTMCSVQIAKTPYASPVRIELTADNLEEHRITTISTAMHTELLYLHVDRAKIGHFLSRKILMTEHFMGRDSQERDHYSYYLFDDTKQQKQLLAQNTDLLPNSTITYYGKYFACISHTGDLYCGHASTSMPWLACPGVIEDTSGQNKTRLIFDQQGITVSQGDNTHTITLTAKD